MAFFPSTSWLECLGLHQLPWAMRNEAGSYPGMWEVRLRGTGVPHSFGKLPSAPDAPYWLCVRKKV